MKIRWTRNSVRLRITPSELDELQRGQEVAEILSLPDGSWNATIRPDAFQTSLFVEHGALILALAKADLAQLAAPESEGVYFHIEGEPPLRYFIEKDFPCAHPRTADAQELPSETFEPSTSFLARNQESD
jgi:hypothetical protein